MGRRLETMRQSEKRQRQRQSEKDDLIRGKKLKIGKEDRKIGIVVEESKSKMGRGLKTMIQREKRQRQSEKDDSTRGNKPKIGKEDRKIDILVKESKSKMGRGLETMRQREKRLKEKEKVKDRISQLSDDILIHILSLLTTKEAHDTSYLSRRWKYLWTHRTCLDFYLDLDYTKYDDAREETKFVNWVNKVCSSIQSPTIDHFILHSNIVPGPIDILDKWVDFATRKGVKHLELSMMHSSGYFFSRPMYSGLEHLRSLVLKNINISGEAIQHFILHCLSLEKLSIEGNSNLRTLQVGVRGDPLHNLKMLKIFNNLYLDDLLICAPVPNLSSFQFQGYHQSNLYIANAPPLLSHVYIGACDDISCVIGPFCKLSTQFSQIKTLELSFKTLYSCSYHHFHPSFKLSSLRELKVSVSNTRDEYQRLGILYLFLNTSPFLHKLIVEIELRQNIIPNKLRQLNYDDIRLEDDVLCTHQYLKVLEVAKFCEHPSVVKFVKDIYKAAAHTLEKIVIDPMPLNTVPPSPSRILFTKHFEELFEEELITPGINQRIEFIL